MPDTILILVMLIAFCAGYLVGHVRGAIALRKQADARKFGGYQPDSFRRW